MPSELQDQVEAEVPATLLAKSPVAKHSMGTTAPESSGRDRVGVGGLGCKWESGPQSSTPLLDT